ncbi:hypothetical protein GCM10023341_24870 [Ornithinimicrobium tianjinense]
MRHPERVAQHLDPAVQPRELQRAAGLRERTTRKPDPEHRPGDDNHHEEGRQGDSRALPQGSRHAASLGDDVFAGRDAT